MDKRTSLGPVNETWKQTKKEIANHGRAPDATCTETEGTEGSNSTDTVALRHVFEKPGGHFRHGG